MRPSFAGVPAAAARANSGGAEDGAPAGSDPDARSRRLGAVPGIGGRAPLRVRWPRGLGCGRPQALAKRGERAGARALTALARCFPTPRPSPERLLRAPSGAVQAPSGPNFAAFSMAFGRASELCPIMQSYRTSPHHDKRGGFRATTA